MSRDDGDTYNVTNKAFLQAFLGRSTLTFEEAKPILAAIFSAHQRRKILVEDVTPDDFNRYVSKANEALSPFDMEIRSTLHQTTRARVWALVNSTSDAMSQLATSYSADEISFLRRVLDVMFETNNRPRSEVMAITATDAINVSKPPGQRRETQTGTGTQGSSDQGLTGVQAEKMMHSLVGQGWFEKSRKHFFSLSPRALMELRGWLTETYNDYEEGEEEDQPLRIKFCCACKEIVTTGQRCSDWRCQCRIHDICTNNFFTSQRSRDCPLCKREWTGDDFVGERAHTGTASAVRRRRGRPGVSPRRNTQAEAAVAKEDDDDLYD